MSRVHGLAVAVLAAASAGAQRRNTSSAAGTLAFGRTVLCAVRRQLSGGAGRHYGFQHLEGRERHRLQDLWSDLGEFSATRNVTAPVCWRWGISAQYDFTRQLGVRFDIDVSKKVGDGSTTGEGDIGLWSVGLVYRF